MAAYEHLSTKQFAITPQKETGGTYPTLVNGKPVPMSMTRFARSIPYIEVKPPRKSN